MDDLPEDWRPVRTDPEPWNLFVWRAWHRLGLDRENDGGMMVAAVPRRIPWTTIEQWACTHQFDDEQAELLHAGILAMDNAYLTFIAGKRTSEKDRAGGELS